VRVGGRRCESARVLQVLTAGADRALARKRATRPAGAARVMMTQMRQGRVACCSVGLASKKLWMTASLPRAARVARVVCIVKFISNPPGEGGSTLAPQGPRRLRTAVPSRLGRRG
jgi:hypothetical protein